MKHNQLEIYGEGFYRVQDADKVINNLQFKLDEETHRLHATSNHLSLTLEKVVELEKKLENQENKPFSWKRFGFVILAIFVLVIVEKLWGAFPSIGVGVALGGFIERWVK